MKKETILVKQGQTRYVAGGSITITNFSGDDIEVDIRKKLKPLSLESSIEVSSNSFTNYIKDFRELNSRLASYPYGQKIKVTVEAID